MLFDLFTYHRTPCSPYIRGMGYLDETLAMRSRYHQRKAAWQPHLDSTRSFILSSAEKCRTRSKVVVLGSGLLLDVPLSVLSLLFREVVLMDIVCLPEVRRQIKKHPNARFIEHDVTNTSERLYKNGQQGIQNLPEVTPSASGHYENSDLVVSLNILSQLTVIPRKYATRRFPSLADDRLHEWCSRIVETHYRSLLSMSCNVCLIADYEFVKRDRNGAVFSRASTISELALPHPDASWKWNIEPIQSNSQFHSKELNVGAWHMGASGKG